MRKARPMNAMKPGVQTLLVTFLLGQPTAVAKILGEHVDDGTGKCRSCGCRARGDRMPWPCPTYTAAKSAHDRQGGR